MKISMIAFLLAAGYLAPAFAEDCDKGSLRFGTLISIGADECNNAILRARAHAIGQSHTIGHCSEIQVAAAVIGAMESVPKSVAQFGRERFCNELDTYMTRVEDTGILGPP